MPASARRSMLIGSVTSSGPSVRMMHKTASMGGSSFVQGLLQGIQHEAGVGRSADAPADDAAGIGVDDEGDIDEAGPGGHVGKVGEPEHVLHRRMELAVDMIERARRRLVADRRPHGLASDHTLQAEKVRHQPLDGAAGNRKAFSHRVAARPCARRRRRSSPRTLFEPRPSVRHRAAPGPNACRRRSAGRHAHDRSKGQSATRGRSARPHTLPDDRR